MQKTNSYHKQYQAGATSILIVLFATLLIGVLTVSFARLMLRDWESATDDNLSKSAYDAALAGVEDAKRALTYLDRVICPVSPERCRIAKDVLFSGERCMATEELKAWDWQNSSDPTSATEAGKSEVRVGNSEMNQAYTCLKIKYNTLDFEDRLTDAKDQVLIPLRASKDFTTVEVSWYDKEDFNAVKVGSVTNMRNLPSASNFFPRNNSWAGRYWPPVLIANYFSLAPQPNLYDVAMESDLYGGDYGVATIAPAEYNTHNYRPPKTLTLRPSSGGMGDPATGTPGTIDTAARMRQLSFIPSDVNTPENIKCSKLPFGYGGFSCSVRIKLTVDDKPIQAHSDNHFLRLARRYSIKSKVQVRLIDKAGGYVGFEGVQPLVDSNGRTADVQRRVLARVQPIGIDDFPFPNGALETNDSANGINKDFHVTDKQCFSGWPCL